MTSSSSGSREQRNVLGSNTKEITRELKRLKAREQKANKRRKYSGFTECEQYFACRLYVLATHQVNVAVLYLRDKQASRTYGSFALLDDAGLKTLVEMWFNGLSASELQLLHPPFIPSTQKLHDKATLFFQEHQLRLWVLDQNVNKGLAPTSGNMNIEFDRIHAPHVGIDDPTLRGDVSLPRNRMWSHRFRKKWNMVLGKVPARDFMCTTAITEKVAYGSVVYIRFFLFSNKRKDGTFTGGAGVSGCGVVVVLRAPGNSVGGGGRYCETEAGKAGSFLGPHFLFPS